MANPVLQNTAPPPVTITTVPLAQPLPSTGGPAVLPSAALPNLAPAIGLPVTPSAPTPTPGAVVVPQPQQ